MIEAIHSAQRLDSRGNPTVQVDVATKYGTFRALVPSGASTGSTEAVELRDHVASVYGGKGVETAVRNVNEVIAPALINSKLDPATQLKAIDRLMCYTDGTPDKSVLGANAILGVSMACARAGAAAQDMPLYEFLRAEAYGTCSSSTPMVMPVPFFNVLNGGEHSGNAMAFQEFMIAPVGAKSMAEAVQMGAEVYHQLKRVVEREFGPSSTGLGDEGGFAPPITHPHEALELLTTAVDETRLTGKIKFGIDPASTSFFRDGAYDLGFKTSTPHRISAAELARLYDGLLDLYPVVLLEDPFAEDDWPAWTAYNQHCAIELVGDDLLTTNVKRVQVAEEKRACNSMLLKVNQIGTVSEAIDANNLCAKIGWNVFVSHRSGETTDDFLADLTVALGAGHLKSGAPCRGERVAKYNRLLDIEDELKARGVPCDYAGANFNSLSYLRKTAQLMDEVPL